MAGSFLVVGDGRTVWPVPSRRLLYASRREEGSGKAGTRPWSDDQDQHRRVALVIGTIVAEHGDPLAGWAGSSLTFGGSAHLAAIRTLDDAGPVVAIFTGLLINARLLVYSASLARRWSDQPLWFRFAG